VCRIVRRGDDVYGASKLPSLQEVACRTIRQPPLHFGSQVAGGVVHRKDVQENLQARGGLRRAEYLCFALMSEAL
jgi:hypothetical protein